MCLEDFDTGFRSLLSGRGWSGDPVEGMMLASLRRLSTVLKDVFPIRFFGGHMEYGDSATCPGDNLLPAVRAMREALKLAAPVHRSF